MTFPKSFVTDKSFILQNPNDSRDCVVSWPGLRKFIYNIFHKTFS